MPRQGQQITPSLLGLSVIMTHDPAKGARARGPEGSYPMWAPPTGPRWLVEDQPSVPPPVYVDPAEPASSVDYSPPTKWPRATTPINPRPEDSMLLGTSADSGVGLSLSFNSPPIVNRVDHCNLSPGLRTPTSRPAVHTGTNPSPFRPFSSPSNVRVLRLSNSENVVGFRYRHGFIEKPPNLAEMTSTSIDSVVSAPPTVSRCLEMPSTSHDGVLDETMPMTMGGEVFDMHYVDTSLIDDSGLFGIDVNLHATSTPIGTTPQPIFDCAPPPVPPVHNPYSDIGQEVANAVSPTPESVIRSSPPTPSSFKRAMRDVQRQGVLQPRKLLADTSNVPNVPSPSVVLEQQDLNSNTYVNKIKESVIKRSERSVSDTFQEPKKPLKPYSRRWMRLVTGATRSQREMTAAAHAFMNRLSQNKDSW